MYKIIIILGVIAILSFTNLVCLGQPTNLTDRELLIQLTGKIEFIEKSVMRIEDYSENTKGRVLLLDKQVTKNEINIASFCEKLEDLMVRWNALLVLFAGFVLGIFVWMWRRAYNGHEKAKFIKTH